MKIGEEVGREVLYQQGCFSMVRIWYNGHVPNINGIFTYGWRREKQTVVTKSVITPIHFWEVLWK
jgi:hypothetical protein